MPDQRPEPPSADILIVDDTPANLRLLSQMLAERGYKARAVTSGARALDAVRANPPDLILLDIMMPGMDGYQAFAKITAGGTKTAVPIIALTAKAMANEREELLAYGFTDYLAKPIDYDSLVAVIARHLPDRR